MTQTDGQETSFDPFAGKYQYVPKTNYSQVRFHHEYIEGMKYVGQKYINEILPAIHPKKNGNYLDIGGGSGEVAEALEQMYGGHTVVTDISPAGLTMFTDKNKAVSDAIHQPFADGSFNLVHLKDVLVHIESHKDLLKEIFRLLKEGGIAVVTTEELNEGKATLYYGSEPNERASIKIDTLQEYNEILERLKNGEKDSEVLTAHSKKINKSIPPDWSAISISPPFFKINLEELLQIVTELGFEVKDIKDYNSSGDTDWYRELNRKVVILRKPLASVKEKQKPFLLRSLFK